MRLWHKDLIQYLPRQQLLSQWRECCCIAKSIAESGTPNHILVNRILDYPIHHFISYTDSVISEMINRGYKVDAEKFRNWINQGDDEHCLAKNIFFEWHNNIYLRQCLYNLEEKAICGGIPAAEWHIIYNQFKNFTSLWGGDEHE